MPHTRLSDAPAIDITPIPNAEAEYQLESAVVCPSCHESVSTLKVIRLLRTQVNFTSALPRRGRAIICPECSSILSAELRSLS